MPKREGDLRVSAGSNFASMRLVMASIKQSSLYVSLPSVRTAPKHSSKTGRMLERTSCRLRTLSCSSAPSHTGRPCVAAAMRSTMAATCWLTVDNA